jgi:hypothetical protein
MARLSLLLAAASLALVASAGACTPPPLLPGQADDAAAQADVELPDVSVPDGYVITAVGTDGAPVAVTAAAACESLDPVDAGLDGGVLPGDASADTPLCAGALAAGDLVFDEVMISTVSGSDDYGQWVEVRNVRACTTDLIGLHASALHGQSFRTLDVTVDTWVPPGGFFLIADTTDSTQNNALPGLVFAWAGSPADAIHKTSDTLTLSVGSVTLDTLTYPDKTRAEATSMAFPWGCAPGLRADFANWRPSTASWAADLFGTPGAPNTDVTCSTPKTAACGGARKDAH